MSIEAVTWALGVDVGDSTRKLVLIGFANHAHKDGRNSWASKDTIAEYANCSKRTVQRHVDALLAAGWLRRGDQQQVAHLRADRRPVVYDVALTEQTRARWESETTTSRDDNLSPRDAEDDAPRGDTVVSPRDDSTNGQPVTPQNGHGVTQPCPPRGDTAVSTEPSLNQELPPHPPASGGSTPTGCPRHPHLPGQCCRRCGTTPRQVAARERREAAERRRRNELEQRAAERERLAAERRASEDVSDLLAATRLAIAAATTARSNR